MYKLKAPKGPDNLASPPIYVSEHDLQDEDIQVCIEALGLEEVLYQIGFDKNHWIGETNNFYEVMECTHRTRTGKVVTGKRYVSVERLDDEWLNSGIASDEAKDASRADLSYLKQIKEISKRSR